MINFYKIIELVKQIVLQNVLDKNIAVDFTLGRGQDTIFLSENFNFVYSFDVQTECIKDFEDRRIENVKLILDTHSNVDKYLKCFDCGLYNLGYLPQGDKSITTLKESTIISLDKSLQLLNVGGIICVAMYTGHDNGREESLAVIDFCQRLSSRSFNVVHLDLINKNKSPSLIVISKTK